MNPTLLKKYMHFWILGQLMLFSFITKGQELTEPLESASLDQVVAYAIAHQPDLRQAQLDEEITEKAIKGKLADWYPQVNFTYNYSRFLKLQSSVIGGNVIRFGVNNTSSAQFTATQNLFNRDVLLASSTASEVREQADLNTSRVKMTVIVNTTKAFYDVLATTQQIQVSRESVTRLERSVEDAYNRYLSGVSDKTDYKRATILLSNAKASLKSQEETLNFKVEFLKTLIGLPQELELSIQYDNASMEQEIGLDTALQLAYTNHIEYQVLESRKNLQDANLLYSKWAFLPTLNLFGAYNFNYQNNQFSELYTTNYPFSYVGATLSFPLMQGGKRVAKIQEQNFTSQRLDVSLQNMENTLTTQYVKAMAAYNSNLAQYEAQKENVELAEEVYEVIQLQYQSGVRTYLDMIVAESDLRTTRINYFNTLYQVLASKMDVMYALGTINY